MNIYSTCYTDGMRSTQRALAFVFVLLCGALGCDDPPAAPTVVIEIINALGDNPATEADRVEIRIAQEDRDPFVVEGDVTDGLFDLPIEVASLTRETRLSVRFFAEDELLSHGASPSFIPAVSGGLARIVVAAPGSCAVLRGAELAFPRHSIGAARADSFVLLAGGSDRDGPSGAIEFFDLLRAATDALPDAEPFGDARAVTLSASRVLITSALRGVTMFDLANLDMREPPVDLLSDSRAIVSRGGSGAVLVDGAQAHFIDARGSIESVALMSERAEPAIAWLGRSALVLGGGGGIETVAAGGALESLREEVIAGSGAVFSRASGVTYVDQESGRALRFRDCPGACVEEGMAYLPREGAAVAGRYIVGGDGSRTVDEVVETGDITPAFELVHPRRDARGVALFSGVLFVFGGEGAEGPRDEVEICVPTTLTE